MTDTKAKLLRGLQFLRVLDAQNNLSLTNIALVAALIRTLLLPNLTIHDLLMFLGAVASYQVKRVLQPATTTDEGAALQTAVAELQTKVTALQMSGQTRRQ